MESLFKDDEYETYTKEADNIQDEFIEAAEKVLQKYCYKYKVRELMYLFYMGLEVIEDQEFDQRNPNRR